MSSVRTWFPVICIALLFFSCKKFVEDKKRQAAMSFITNGHWVIQSYLIDTVSVTDQFAGYNFKFNDDGTVKGINGTVTETGTWAGEVSNYSITSEFPAATEPIVKLNGTWIIKDSGLDYVKADRKTSSAVMHLHLRKVP